MRSAFMTFMEMSVNGASTITMHACPATYKLIGYKLKKAPSVYTAVVAGKILLQKHVLARVEKVRVSQQKVTLLDLDWSSALFCLSSHNPMN